jgi:TatD DNase family protein
MQPYLLHCFAGDESDVERAVALGAYFGVDGPVTYKKSEDYRQLIKRIPLDRLVLETDSPYLSPEPVRSKPNSPANLPLINAKMAALFDLTIEEAAKQFTANAVRFFRLESRA